MRDVEKTISTGEFARLSGLSVKALRLYDVSGLLRPISTDPVTGYRRYAPDQLERARRISLLRGMEMPLGVIAEVLAGTDEEAGLRLDRRSRPRSISRSWSRRSARPSGSCAST